MAIAFKTITKGEQNIHTCKTINGTFQTFLRHNLLAKNTVLFCGRDKNRIIELPTNRKVRDSTNNLRDPRDCVRIVLPSEWARLDISTLPIYNAMFNGGSTSKNELSIEQASLISERNRAKYIGDRRFLWARYQQTVLPSSQGDSLTITCGHLKDKHDFSNDAWGRSIANGSSTFKFNGRIGPSIITKTESNNILECPQDQPEEEQLLCTLISKATHTFQDIIDMLRSSEKSASARQSNSSTTRNTRGRGRGGRSSMRTNIHVKNNTAGDRQENERLRNPINYNELFLFPGEVQIVA